ncbi:MAG: hypothetical protein JSW55_05385 [Chloroflexota bacterium]|nr:MAG: hypothetical protein JSW55_05385 [Chloroflexota bacterium]
MAEDILSKLSGGDRRSIGHVDEVIADVQAEPALFDALFWGMRDEDPLVRMRTADAVEKLSAAEPGLLQPYKNALLTEIAPVRQQEVRWHMAQMLPRLNLSPAERRQAMAILRGYLDDRSKIVKTFAMQAMADLALQQPDLKPEVIPLLRQLTETGSPAMQSRGRKLLSTLDEADA